MSIGNTLGSCAVVMQASISTQIGDEFEQRAVRIAKIYARACTLRAEALDRPGVDRHAQALEMGNGVGNGPVPFEAKVAVAGLDRKARHLGRMKSRPMQIELDPTEAVGPTLRPTNELGAEHVAIERVRALPVGNVHNAMIERDGQRHGCPVLQRVAKPTWCASARRVDGRRDLPRRGALRSTPRADAASSRL